jgi:large subunit ribosomal protein L24
MNRKKFHVKKGDVVKVISGNHKGASGKIIEVLSKNDRVLVEGVRLIKKSTRKSQTHPNGGIIEREGPIHISNVRLVEAPAAKAEKSPKPKKTAKKSPKKAS